jgi:hypothetical protein
MQDTPSPDVMLQAVATFLRQVAAPGLVGHAGFEARVAANAVDLVRRALLRDPAADTAEQARLSTLTGAAGPAATLTAELASMIRTGRIAADDPALLDHLWLTTLDKVAVDQPTYAPFRAATADTLT